MSGLVFASAILAGDETASAREVSVDWATAAGTAGAGADYIAAAGTLTFALAPARIAEAGGSATITVSVANGVFAGDQVIELDLAGSAGAEDFTLAGPGGALAAPYRLTLVAGATSVSATLAAVDDAVYEGDETVEVSASHGGVAIGASHTVTITDEGDRAQVTQMVNTSPVLHDNVVDLWPGVVLVMFDREVDGLEAHEVEVTNALVTSVKHQGQGGQVRSIYKVAYVATGEAGERMTVHVPENVVDGGNAPSAAEVDYSAVIRGTDALATLSTTAAEPVTGEFEVSLVFSTDICWESTVDTTNESVVCPLRPLQARLHVADFEIAGGSAIYFNRDSTTRLPYDEFRLRVVPDADLEGPLVVVLPSGVAASADGGRTGGARLEVEVDTRAPRLQAATVSGEELTLSWHEAVAGVPAAGDFAVTVGGSAVAVSAVAVDGAKVVLTLAEEAESGDAVVLSYTPGAVPIADAAGNEAAALVGESVDGGVDARAPVTAHLPANTVKGVGEGITSSGGNNYTRDNVASNTMTWQTAPPANSQMRGRSGEPLTAAFENVPSNHDGSSAFTLRMAFSEDVEITPEAMRDHALTVIGGAVTEAHRVDERSDLWEFTVEPSSSGEVSILVSAGRACAEIGALCTSDGRMLSTGLGRSVPGPASLPPLTASFVSVPAEHDGSGKFWLELTFDAPVAQGSRKHIRALLGVTGGVVKKLRRKAGRLDHWKIRVEPSSHDAVTVSLAPSPACGETGAVCTPDGRTFTTAIATRIQGPPGLTVADAEVDEEANAVLAFAVTLSRAPSGTVTVDYATADGTATAGSDYTARSGTLTFAAGETGKTVSVPVLDDAHDEGSETLTLTLSSPSGAYIEDGVATGTINNSDLMPKAWLGRFGRTVADQVLDAVEGRMTASRVAGTELSVAGRRISGAGASDALEKHESGAWREALTDWLRGEEEDAAEGQVKDRDFLTGSSFALTRGTAEGGFGAPGRRCAPRTAPPTSTAITPMPARYWNRSATKENCM